MMLHGPLPPCFCGKNCSLPWYQRPFEWLRWDYQYWWTDHLLLAMEGE